jgi:uncharacterized Tic20 family protein
MKKNQQNTNAFLIHISAFAGFVFPFGQIITPLIAWQTLKDRSPFLDEQGKEAINFNLSYTLYAFILSIMGLGAISVILYLVGISLIIIAALKAKEGESYKYPFTIKFIK